MSTEALNVEEPFMHDAQPVKTITLNRRKGQTTISLSGVCDIFEVTTLKDTFSKAVNDEATTKIVIDCKDLARVDTSTAQLLASLFSTKSAAGKSLSMVNIPVHVETYLDNAGISLS